MTRWDVTIAFGALLQAYAEVYVWQSKALNVSLRQVSENVRFTDTSQDVKAFWGYRIK